MRAGRSGRSKGRTLALALAVQAAILGVTAFVAFQEEPIAHPPAFSGERVLLAESERPRVRERVRELNQRMSKPRSFQPLAVEKAFQDDLPQLPALPDTDVDMAGLEDELLLGQGRFFEESLAELSRGLGGGGSVAEFFGVRDSGERIVIVVNTSASVVSKAAKRGVSIEQIQEETVRLIDGLGGATVFGIVQFSQGTRLFSEHLAPALARNKLAAAAWVRGNLRGNPPAPRDSELVGHEAALAEAFALGPDLVFLVTDGVLNRRTAKTGGGYRYPTIAFGTLLSFVDREALEAGLRPKVHVVGFELGELERAGLNRLARRFGGSLREL